MLCVISFLLLIFRITYPHFISQDPIVISNLQTSEIKLDSAAVFTEPTRGTVSKVHTSLFVFNPNTIGRKELLDLGLTEKTAANFLKFRNKGFIFKRKEDLKKVYGITESLYLKLEPYILVEKEAEQNATLKAQQVKPAPRTLELNSADSIALLQINGIGPSFAKRIIKYKTLLGGFVVVDQLKEVYGFTPELFEKIKASLTVDQTLIKKIDLNKDDFKTINKHPYFSYELTKALFDTRRKGAIDLENLKELMNDEALYIKAIPYLNF